jgi:hypothetical protein
MVCQVLFSFFLLLEKTGTKRRGTIYLIDFIHPIVTEGGTVKKGAFQKVPRFRGSSPPAEEIKGPDAVPDGSGETDIGQRIRDRPRPNQDGPVVYEPEQMEDRDEKKDGAGNDQVQLVTHFITPTCRLTKIG